jgi:hypothetical protein
MPATRGLVSFGIRKRLDRGTPMAPVDGDALGPGGTPPPATPSAGHSAPRREATRASDAAFKSSPKRSSGRRSRPSAPGCSGTILERLARQRFLRRLTAWLARQAPP